MNAHSKLSEFQREWVDLQPDLQERSNKKAEQLIQHGKKRRKSDQSHKPRSAKKNTVISPSSPISPSTYVCILSTQAGQTEDKSKTSSKVSTYFGL